MKLFESIKSFQYKLPTQPEKMLYDFYFLVGYCRGAFADDKVLSFVVEEAVDDCTKALQKHMIKALKWSLSCEARHAQSKVYRSSDLASLKPEHQKILITYFKELSALGASAVQDILRQVDKSRTLKGKVNKSAKRNPDIVSGRFHELPGRGDEFAKSAMAMQATVKKLKITDEKLAEFYQELYGLEWRGSYGGEAWANIAKCLEKLVKAKDTSSRIVWLDHAYDLQHNTDSVFNKVPAYYSSDSGYSWIADALDWKRDAKDPTAFYDKVSGSLKEVVAYISYHLYGKSILGRKGKLPEPKKAPVMTGSGVDIYVGQVLELDLAGNKDQLHKDGVLSLLADDPFNFKTVKVVIFNVDDPSTPGAIFITADDLTTAEFYHKLEFSYLLHSAEGEAKAYIKANPQLEEVAPFAQNCARWIPSTLLTKIGTVVKDSSTTASKKASSTKVFEPGTEIELDSDSVAKFLKAHPDNDEGFLNFIVEMGVDVKLLVTSVEGYPKDLIGCAVLSVDGESAGDENYDRMSKAFLYNMPSKDKSAFPNLANYGWYAFLREALEGITGLSAQQGNAPSFEEALKNPKTLYRLEFPKETPEGGHGLVLSKYFKYLESLKIPIEFYIADADNDDSDPFIVVTKEGENTPDDEGYNNGRTMFLYNPTYSKDSKLLAKMKRDLGLSEKTLAQYTYMSMLKQLYERGYITIVNRDVSSKEEPAAQPLAEKFPYDKRDILKSFVKAYTSWPQATAQRDIVFLNMLNADIPAKARRLYIAKVVKKLKGVLYEVQVLDDLTDEQRNDLGLHYGTDSPPSGSPSKSPPDRYFIGSDNLIPISEYAVSISNKGDSAGELAWLTDTSKNTIHEYLNYGAPTEITMYGRIMRYADYRNEAHDRIAIVSFLAVLEGRAGAKELDAKTIKAAIPEGVLRKFGEPYDEHNKYCLRVPLSALDLTDSAKNVLFELGYA